MTQTSGYGAVGSRGYRTVTGRLDAPAPQSTPGPFADWYLATLVVRCSRPAGRPMEGLAVSVWTYRCRICELEFEVDSAVQDLLHTAPIHRRADLPVLPCPGSGWLTEKVTASQPHSKGVELRND